MINYGQLKKLMRLHCSTMEMSYYTSKYNYRRSQCHSDASVMAMTKMVFRLMSWYCMVNYIHLSNDSIKYVV